MAYRFCGSLLAAIVLLLPTTLRADAFANAHPKNPVQALQLSGELGHMDIMLATMKLQTGSDISEHRADLASAVEHLDSSAAPAVKFAGKHPDLVSAIKAYYTAASAYLAAGIPIDRFQQLNSDRLENDMEAKDKALDLEKKLAGIQ